MRLRPISDWRERVQHSPDYLVFVTASLLWLFCSISVLRGSSLDFPWCLVEGPWDYWTVVAHAWYFLLAGIAGLAAIILDIVIDDDPFPSR